jgi:hypothetical protein
MPTTTTTLVKSPIILPLGVTEPAFTDTITENGQTVGNIESVKFYMRPLLSRVPTLDGESGEVIKPVNEEGNNVKYEWQEEDRAVEGEFMAWWGFFIGSSEHQTPEFPITISDHGPGTGVKTGAIADGVADHMPTTYEALRSDSSFGERRIQKIATLIQLRVLKSYVQPDEEISIYELPMLDYFSKRVALELCTPGIDYWGRQLRTQTAQNPTEISSFPDMIAALEKLRDRLVVELEENWRELQFFVPELKERKAVPLPASSFEFSERPEPNGNLRRLAYPRGFVTRDPYTTQPLVTGWIGELDSYELGFYPFP